MARDLCLCLAGGDAAVYEKTIILGNKRKDSI